MTIIKKILISLAMVAAITGLFLLFTGQLQADTLLDELDRQDVSYVYKSLVTPSGPTGVLYLMDDTDPDDVCDMVEQHPEPTINHVRNVSRLSDVGCGVTK